MASWLRRIRGVLGMGVAWAIGWAIIGGGLMEALIDPHGRILDMWPQTLAIPGFVGGVMFSGLLQITERRRQFDDLSLRRFGALGAVTGLLLSSLAVGAGLASNGLVLWQRLLFIVAPVTLMSALSAWGTLALARLAGGRGAVAAIVRPRPGSDGAIRR